MALLSTIVTACWSERRPTDEEIDGLADDAHVVIAGTHLTLPFAAIGGFTGPGGADFAIHAHPDGTVEWEAIAAFRRVAASPRTAPRMTNLEFSIGPYGWSDVDPRHRRICPRLRRSWAKSVCDDPWAPLEQAMPVNAVHFVDLRRLDVFDNWYTASGERKIDQLRAMRLEPGKPSLVCDRNSPTRTRSCTAALRIGGELGAVWSVWEGAEQQTETARDMADREGATILAFVQHALGPRENFQTLQEESCRLRRPGSVDGPEGSACRPPTGR